MEFDRAYALNKPGSVGHLLLLKFEREFDAQVSQPGATVIAFCGSSAHRHWMQFRHRHGVLRKAYWDAMAQ